ncbi:TPA: hypothetical protein G8V49_001155 [Salmonella enterica]|uniref:Autotransporter outer membrane beta-barrel domain-containing protein n=1 Tax=Salmonella enterica TaxID=28901 RepID=A0A759WBX7_SALER|nr:hypothetical protein [Salmonella enterica]
MMRLSIVFIVLTGLSGYVCATSTIDTYGNTTYLGDDDGNTTTYDNFGGIVYGSDGSTIDNFGGTTYVNDGNGHTTTYDKFGNTTYGSDGSTIDTYAILLTLMMGMATLQHVINTEIRLTVID